MRVHLCVIVYTADGVRLDLSREGDMPAVPTVGLGVYNATEAAEAGPDGVVLRPETVVEEVGWDVDAAAFAAQLKTDNRWGTRARRRPVKPRLPGGSEHLLANEYRGWTVDWRAPMTDEQQARMAAPKPPAPP
jgi:hypothetical protein